MATMRPAALATPASGRRRRRLVPIIDAAFQWKYTAVVLALGAGTAGVMGALWYRVHLSNTRLLSLDDRLQAQVAQGDRELLLYLVACIVGFAVALGVWGLIVTHRIAGPIYMLARYCDVLARGHYPDVRPLRKHDELQRGFSAFAAAVHALRDRDLEALRTVERGLADAQAHLEDEDATGLRQGLAQSIASLEAQRQILARALGQGEGVSVD